LILPGGIEMARQVGPALNISMFDGGLLDNAETIRINNAPGIITTFQNVGSIFAFDPVGDCLYTGQSINDTLQMCIRQVNQSIAVGRFQFLLHNQTIVTLTLPRQDGRRVPRSYTTPKPVTATVRGPQHR
jgi:hypothetical protein